MDSAWLWMALQCRAFLGVGGPPYAVTVSRPTRLPTSAGEKVPAGRQASRRAIPRDSHAADPPLSLTTPARAARQAPRGARPLSRARQQVPTSWGREFFWPPIFFWIQFLISRSILFSVGSGLLTKARWNGTCARLHRNGSREWPIKALS